MFYIFIEFIYWLIDFDMDYLFCYFGSNLISGTTINLPAMLILIIIKINGVNYFLLSQ